MNGPTDDRAEIGQMQAGLRAWVHRVAADGARGLRAVPPPVLLSLLCSAAISPLLAAVAGVVAPVVVTGSSVLSGVGGGVLSGIILEALDRLRSDKEGRLTSSTDFETQLADEIGRVLVSGDANAETLRAEIAALLREIDAGGTVLRAAMEAGNEQIRNDIAVAVGQLGSNFIELMFLIQDLALAAAEIQLSLDMQGADVRAVINLNNRQATDIRLIRDDVAKIAQQTGIEMFAGSTDSGGNTRWERGCPYRGLLPFEEGDAEVFYGRERLTAELTAKIAARVAEGGIIVVTGASGAGKSSLLQAGLLPKLASGRQLPGSESWLRIVMTPAKDPLPELAVHLAALSGASAMPLRDDLVQHASEAHMAVWSALLAANAHHRYQLPSAQAAKLVLIVDQLEQIFTLNPGPDGEPGRQAFIAALHSAATKPVGPRQQPPALIIIAVRGDFWDRCAAYPQLADALQDGQFVVTPMTETEFRLAITGPTESARLSIDPALVTAILGDLRAELAGDASGALPLLSQAMALTWEKREGNRLTSRGYDQCGGVRNAVRVSAEGVYAALPPVQQSLARQLLRTMTVSTREGQFSRRPVTRAVLYAAHSGADRRQLDAVLEAFAAERLIVLDGNSAQLSHDVLFTAWPRLREWLEDDQVSWILHGQLADDAAAWRDHGDDASFLYRGTQLVQLRQASQRWAADPERSPTLAESERHFLLASERAVTRSIRWRRGAFTLLAGLAATALVVYVFALQQRATANQLALYNRLSAVISQTDGVNSSLGALFGVEAYDQQPNTESAARLVGTENTPLSNSLTAGNAEIAALSFSSDGQRLIGSTGQGALWSWNVNNPYLPRQFGHEFSNGGSIYMALSPDGRTVADGGVGVMRLVDISDPGHPRLASERTFTSRSGNVLGPLVFSPDGRILATSTNTSNYTDAGIQLWDVANPYAPAPIGVPLPGHASDINSVAFSPDGAVLAAGGDIDGHGMIWLWNVSNPAHPRQVFSQTTGAGSVWSVAFGLHGRTLASGGSDAEVRLWDAADPTQLREIGDPFSASSGTEVPALAFSSNGLLATGGDDGTVRLWNVSDPTRPEQVGQPLMGALGSVWSLAFSPAGNTLAAGDGVGHIWLWHIPRTTLIGARGSVRALAFAPDGHLLAVGSNDGSVRLWDVSDPASPEEIGPTLPGGSAASFAFAPDHQTLAIGDYAKGTVQLWNIADPVHPQPMGSPIPGAPGVAAISYSPDGRTLAIVNANNGEIALWNVTDPTQPRQWLRPLQGGVSGIFSLSFSRNSQILVTGGSDGNIRLWDVADPSKSHLVGTPTPVSAAGILSVTVSGDGKVVASGQGDGTIQLYSISDGLSLRKIGKPLTESNTAITSLAFSSNGKELVTGIEGNGQVGIWDLSNLAHPLPVDQPLPGSPSSVLAVAFSPDGSILATGNVDHTVRLWNFNTAYAIRYICTNTAGDLGSRQWNNYFPDVPFKTPCRG